MRIMVLFDLPVTTPEGRKEAAKFRNFLLNDGYNMLQFSVYSRICSGPDATQKHIVRINKNLPPQGSVRLLTVTEKQYSKMMFLLGEPTIQEKFVVSEQLTFF